MKAIHRLFIGILFAFLVAAPVLSVVTPQVSSVAAGPCDKRLLGIPPWYRGLTDDNEKSCAIKTPKGSNGISGFIWKIVLNIIEIAIVITAYIAVFFILYGGFQFLVGGSNPSLIEKARKSILNAVIGLVIAMSAIAIINLIFRILP